MGFTDEVNLILIGRLGKPVGLKGHINLIAHSDNPSGLSKYKEFFIDANGIHKFTLDKMTEKLDEIVKPHMDKVPQQVGLQLPKLQKVSNSEPPKIKLPKLKKVTNEATV